MKQRIAYAETHPSNTDELIGVLKEQAAAVGSEQWVGAYRRARRYEEKYWAMAKAGTDSPVVVEE
jgi:hypothetical protein